MKLPSLLLALASAATLSVHAEVSPIRMFVEQTNKTEVKDKKNTHDKTQVRSLKIQLDNGSAQTFDGLVVKYWFLGHAVTDRTIKPIAEGERKSAMTPRGKDVVESEVVSKHFTEEHYDAKKKAKVPATGEKIVGYAVRVMQGEKILAEHYSEPGYKDLLDKPAAAAPAPAVKPAPGAKPAKK
jgi:hypothetical protein